MQRIDDLTPRVNRACFWLALLLYPIAALICGATLEWVIGGEGIVLAFALALLWFAQEKG